MIWDLALLAIATWACGSRGPSHGNVWKPCSYLFVFVIGRQACEGAPAAHVPHASGRVTKHAAWSCPRASQCCSAIGRRGAPRPLRSGAGTCLPQSLRDGRRYRRAHTGLCRPGPFGCVCLGQCVSRPGPGNNPSLIPTVPTFTQAPAQQVAARAPPGRHDGLSRLPLRINPSHGDPGP
jgi:hypothetical protein